MTVMPERPTTDGTGPRRFEELCEALDELNAPDGFNAEIIRGNIVVSPWSKAYYLDVMDPVCDQLRPCLPEGHRISSAPALYVFPGVERAYGPDVHVYWAPTTKGYASHLTVPFGEKIHIPAPFDCHFDTTGFQAPAQD
ncbi:hypothetical protein [Streptomyces sp. NPDC006274]|uniref:hypothetical protein n=1 Tax=unclassified Streptomyces TaxID=2593676 RepID=UPI0033B7DE46